MNRRGFLGALMGGLVFDPERALWSPHRRKLISIPKPRRIGDILHVRKPYRYKVGDPIMLYNPQFAPLPVFRLDTITPELFREMHNRYVVTEFAV